MSEAVDWSSGAPRSERFGDIYFSPEDGLAESRAVFLEGCGLPGAWAGRACFTVAELGFGTGRNVLALIELWGRTRPSPTAVLNIFSLDAHLIAVEDAARALAPFEALAPLALPLLRRWPDRPEGRRRVEWPDLGVILDLALGEAATALEDWDGSADAWFLDGFAPALNPEMWRAELLNLVRRRSRPQARAASFTAAGAVRRGLEAEGFHVVRRPGFGRKKHRLEAQLSERGQGARSPSGPPVIIGAGIGGAALARAFRRLGHDPLILDAVGRGAGASGNPAALVNLRLDAGGGLAAQLHLDAFLRASRLYRDETPQAVLSEGLLQLARAPRDAARFERLMRWSALPPGTLRRLGPDEAASRLGEASAPEALEIPGALVVDPESILRAWAPDVQIARAAGVRRVGEVIEVLDDAGGVLAASDLVVFTAGADLEGLAGPLGLRYVRGQVSLASKGRFFGAAASWGGYATPSRHGVLFGATHDRGELSTEVRRQDHRRNLEALAVMRPRLAKEASSGALSGRAGVRAARPDHLPLAGRIGEAGPYVLGGFGGRGFTLAPLLAEAVAADALGAPGPLPRRLKSLIDPGR